MVDGMLIIGFLMIFDWFCWKWGFWYIPSSVFGLVQPCRGLFFRRKTALLRKNMIFDDFQLIFYFLLKWTWLGIKSRNHYQNRHPDPCRILAGTLNPWNRRPRVVPWPILFERVAKKCPVNHHSIQVWQMSFQWSGTDPSIVAWPLCYSWYAERKNSRGRAL